MPGNLLQGANTSGKIYKFSGFSSTITDSFIKANTGIAWDGTNIMWTNNGNPKKGTGFTGTVSAIFTFGAVQSIDWDGTNLLAAQDDRKFFRFSGFSSTVSSSFLEASGICQNRGVTWDGTNVYGSDAVGIKYRQYSGFTSTVTTSFLGYAGQKAISWD